MVSCAKELPVNECVSNMDAIDVERNENSPDDIEFEKESHEDSMSHFMDGEEDLVNDQENANYLGSKSTNSNVKKSRKTLLF